MKSLLVVLAALFSTANAFAATVITPAANCSLDDLGIPMRAMAATPAAAPTLPELANYNYEIRRELTQIGDTVASGYSVDFATTMAKLNDMDLTVVDAQSCSDPSWKFSVVYLKMLDGSVKAFRFNTQLNQ